MCLPPATSAHRVATDRLAASQSQPRTQTINPGQQTPALHLHVLFLVACMHMFLQRVHFLVECMHMFPQRVTVITSSQTSSYGWPSSYLLLCVVAPLAWRVMELRAVFWHILTNHDPSEFHRLVSCACDAHDATLAAFLTHATPLSLLRHACATSYYQKHNIRRYGFHGTRWGPG